MPRPRPHSAPGYIEPMKALPVAGFPPGDWSLEVKFDGYRLIAVMQKGRPVQLWSRNRIAREEHYPEVAAAVAKLPCRAAVLDGEVVALDAGGHSHFQLLQQLQNGGKRPPVAYYVFDLLHLDGKSLLHEPLETRQAALKKLVGRGGKILRRSTPFDVAPKKFIAAARRQGLEGIVAKRRGSPYEPGRRSGAWIKYRFHIGQEFVIGGYTAPRGSREHFGAVLIGYYRDKQLMYAGKVGAGFDRRKLAELFARFSKLRRDTPPFAEMNLPASERKFVQWLEPRLVCQVKFSEWTADGSLRHPVFLGLRDDKAAREVVREASPR